MSRKVCATGSALLTFVALSLGLSACSSSDEAVTDPNVGGVAECDEAALSAAISQGLVAEGSDTSLISLDGFTCLDGWATTFPTIGSDADTAVTVTQVFQAEGQFWIPKDRNDVCGTTDMNDPTIYPSDSQVPEGIWQDACQTN
ncbi:MAG: hypothetical protein WAO33_10070 [Candidatus Nanopelagicales bacterium]|jgi:hypothetical protein|nr:hypothetical protein [Actinomycetes bacterium]